MHFFCYHPVTLLATQVLILKSTCAAKIIISYFSLLVKNHSYLPHMLQKLRCSKENVYSIANNWCEPHIVNSPPPLPHPEIGHRAVKIKQIYIVLLIHPQRTKAKGIALLSTEDGCSPSPLQTPGTGIWTWHHTNPAMWLLEQNQVMFSQESRAAKMQLPVPLCP